MLYSSLSHRRAFALSPGLAFVNSAAVTILVLASVAHVHEFLSATDLGGHRPPNSVCVDFECSGAKAGVRVCGGHC